MIGSTTVKMTLAIDVDLDQWADTYGHTAAEARSDVRSYLPALVFESVEARLQALGTGCRLVGIEHVTSRPRRAERVPA